jgi:hypothetical protein
MKYHYKKPYQIIHLSDLGKIVFVDTRKLKKVLDYDDFNLLEKATCIVDETEQGLEYLRKLEKVFNEFNSTDKSFSIIGQWEVVKETQQPYQPYSMPTENSDRLDNPTTDLS